MLLFKICDRKLILYRIIENKKFSDFMISLFYCILNLLPFLCSNADFPNVRQNSLEKQNFCNNLQPVSDTVKIFQYDFNCELSVMSNPAELVLPSSPHTSKKFMTSTFLSKRFAYSKCKSASKTNSKTYTGNECQSNNMQNGSGGIGGICVDTIRRSRQNVAIATQVLSPRAFGTALKSHRENKTFGPLEDDEVGFFPFKRRTAWKKLAYYGLIFISVILTLIAIITTIGYLKSEQAKKVSSRIPIKRWMIEKDIANTRRTTTLEPSKSLNPTETQDFIPTAYSSFLISSPIESNPEKDTETPSASVETAENINGTERNEDEEYYSNTQYFEDIPYESPKESSEQDESWIPIPHEPFYVNGHGHHPPSAREPPTMHQYDDPENDHSETEINPSTLISIRNATKSTKASEVVSESLVPNDDDVADNITDNKDDTSALPVEEVKMTEAFAQINAPGEDVFSIEVPIYTTNRTIIQAENNESDQSSSNDNSTLALLSESVVHIQSDAVKDDSNEKIQIESHKTIEENYKVDEEKQATKNAENGNEDDGENFHRAVLHTALFNVEDHAPKYIENVEETIDPHLKSNEKFELNQSKGFSKSRRLQNRIKGRNKKIKIYKNDNVLNLKATYTPAIKNKTGNDSKFQRAETSNLQAGIGEYVDLKELLKSASRRLPKLSKAGSDYDLNESGRSLSSSSRFPSLETMLKTIFSSNPGVLSQTFSHSSNNFPINGFETKDPTYAEHTNFGANFASSLNQIISPMLSISASTPSSYSENDELSTTQFRQSPAVGSIGSPSASGATLNNIYPPLFPIYQSPVTPAIFDFSASGTNQPSSYISPGIIPLDLSSSYIPVGLGLHPFAASSNGDSNIHQSGLNSFYNSPFSTATPSYTFNTPDHTKINEQFGSTGNLGLGTLTTSAGQPPTYNTIAQGMHLLNMISGVIPNTYFHDQVYHPNYASSISPLHNPTTTSSNALLSTAANQFQSDNLGFPAISNLPTTQTHSALPFSRYPTNLVQPEHASYLDVSQEPSGTHPKTYKIINKATSEKHATLQATQPTLEPSKESNERHVFHFEDEVEAHPAVDIGEDEDQVPEASAITQKKLVPTVAINHRKTTTEITPLLQSSAYSSRHEDKDKNLFKEITRKHNSAQSQPKSFSLEILPTKHLLNRLTQQQWPSSSRGIMEDTLRSLNPDIIHTYLDSYVSNSKSKKKASVTLDIPKKPYHQHFGDTPLAITTSGQSGIRNPIYNYNQFHFQRNPSSLYEENEISPQQNAIVEQEISFNLKNATANHKKLQKYNTSGSGLNIKSGFFIADQ